MGGELENLGAVVRELEQALVDLQEIDGGLRFYAELKAPERASFRDAFNRIQDDAVWLQDVVEDLTGVRRAEVNGRDVEPLTFALDAGIESQTQDTVDARLVATGKFENMIRRAIGVARRRDRLRPSVLREDQPSACDRAGGGAMPNGPEIDHARLERLEQGIEDVRTLLRVWRKCAANEKLTETDNAAFSEAHNRMQELAGVLTDDVTDMTGIAHKDIGGKVIGLFAGAVDTNLFDWTVWAAPARINALRDSESVLARTIGLVKNGYKPIVERRKERTKLSKFEQARQTMLEKLLELRGTAGYANPTKLAPILGRTLIDVADDAWTLNRQGYVTIVPAGDQRGPEGGDQPGIIDIRLTELGVQRAKEGYQAVAGQQPVHQTNNNTFLTTGGTLNVAQTGTGDVFQRIEHANNADEIHRLLGEMRQAIAAVSALPESDREEGLVYVEQLTSELKQPKPRPSMLKIPWTGLGRIADVSGAIDGGAKVVEIYGQLEPLITPMLQALSGG